MTRKRGRAVTAALAVAAATGVWGLAAAPPAAAYVCAFGIDKPPTAGSTVTSLTGPFVVRQGSAERVLEVAFTSWPGGDAPPAVTRRGAAVGPTDRYDVAVGGLTRNGTYKARVKASHAGTGIFNCVDGLGQDQRDVERSGEVTFGVSVRALSPTNVQARFDPTSRTATVTWDKSSDPDIAGYKVIRKVGSEEPTSVDLPPEPRSWTDDKLPSGAATIAYSVRAARVGPDPGTTSELSDPAAAAPLQVPAPPPPTTTIPGTPAGTSATATTVKAGAPPTGGTSPTTRPFVLGRPVAGAPPRAGNAELPKSDLNLPEGASADQGEYRPLLPYPARDDLEVDAEVAADPAVVGRSEGPGGDGVPQLAYVASGLLSFVVAAHVLWLRRQVAEPEAAGGPPSAPLEPLEPLEPAPPSPRSPVPAPPEPVSPPPEPADDAPPPEGANPFRPVLLVEALRRGDAAQSATEDGRQRGDGTGDARSDRRTPRVASRPARQPLQATNRHDLAPRAARAVAAAGRRPLRAPSREPAAAAEAPSPRLSAASPDEDRPANPAEKLRRAGRTPPGGVRRPLRSPTRSPAPPSSVARDTPRERPLVPPIVVPSPPPPAPRVQAAAPAVSAHRRPPPAATPQHAEKGRDVAATSPAADSKGGGAAGSASGAPVGPKPVLIVKRPQ